MSEERISKLEKLLEKNPENVLARYAVANEYFKLGRYGEAAEAANAYLELKLFLNSLKTKGVLLQ